VKNSQKNGIVAEKQINSEKLLYKESSMGRVLRGFNCRQLTNRRTPVRRSKTAIE
jgi:hypothetical protein